MPLPYSAVQTALETSSFEAIALRMRCLMLRNIAGTEYRFVDPYDASITAEPGCIIASPSYPEGDPNTTQDYVHNWTRDAALTAMELEAQGLATDDFAGDYVAFAALCQQRARDAAKFDYACFNVDGNLRTIPRWSCQSDGPALQTLAVIALWGRLDPPARAQAEQLVNANLDFLLHAYRDDTTTPWEERSGGCFFARSVQRRCFDAIRTNTAGIDVPDGIDEAIGWLDDALAAHWDEGAGCYLTLEPRSDGYDPNIDIVLAALYGSIETTDPKLLATAAKLHEQWSPGGAFAYEINASDADRGIGPLLGRYPTDHYDGDGDHTGDGHPWALCTCAFAELCHRVAADVDAGRAPTTDPLAAPFFARVGGSAGELREAGDRMLRAVVFHSDHLELSEQFARDTGFEKSVRNLTWSYSSFLAAVRARAAAA
jgi:glucoamylase